jgi:hypothetical protein
VTEPHIQAIAVDDGGTISLDRLDHVLGQKPVDPAAAAALRVLHDDLGMRTYSERALFLAGDEVLPEDLTRVAVLGGSAAVPTALVSLWRPERAGESRAQHAPMRLLQLGRPPSAMSSRDRPGVRSVIGSRL